MEAIITYIGSSLFLLALGIALGVILVAAFVKSCSLFGLLTVRRDTREWYHHVKSSE